MLRSFEYRLYPTKKQEVRLYSQLHLCTELYNFMLSQCKETYKQSGKCLTRFDLNKKITEMKRSDQRFKSVYSQVLQNQADRLSKAFDNFFRRCKEKRNGKNVKVGYPRFKKLTHSITYPQNQGSFKLVGNKLEVSKIGRIPIVVHRPLSGTIKTLTIKRDQAGQWFAVFSCEVNIPQPLDHQGSVVGMDQGLGHLLVASDGLVIDPPKYLRQAEKRLKKRQRRLSKKVMGSKNRRKAKRFLAKLHLKVENQRNDFLHQLSRRLANEYSIIAVEDLQVENLVKNHHVAKSFHDTGLSTLIQMLEYKVSETGSRLVKVDAAFTSQTCSQCGFVREGKEKVMLGERTYFCPSCGLSLDRDLNAAQNILARAGLARSHACGDDVRLPKEEAVVVEAGTTYSAKDGVGSSQLRL